MKSLITTCICSLALMLSSAPLFAATIVAGSVSGEFGELLPLTNIDIYELDQYAESGKTKTLVKLISTDVEGSYLVELKPGYYFFDIDHENVDLDRPVHIKPIGLSIIDFDYNYVFVEHKTSCYFQLNCCSIGLIPAPPLPDVTLKVSFEADWQEHSEFKLLNEAGELIETLPALSHGTSFHWLEAGMYQVQWWKDGTLIDRQEIEIKNWRQEIHFSDFRQQEDPLAEFEWSFFPNPAQDWVQVSWNELSDPEFLQLSDLQGRILKRIPVDAQAGFARLEIQDLPSGQLQLQLISKDFQESQTLIHIRR
jgi:hypothetical protein